MPKMPRAGMHILVVMKTTKQNAALCVEAANMRMIIHLIIPMLVGKIYLAIELKPEISGF